MSTALLAVLKAAVLPPGLILLLALAALLCLAYRKILSVMLITTALLLLYLLSTPAVAHWLAALVEREQSPAAVEEVRQRAGAIVVLGCNRYSNAPEFGRDDVSACSLVRLRYAAELHQRTGLPVLLSGGSPLGETEPESEVMARVLREPFGIEPGWLETQSRNTDENARFSAEILKSAGIEGVCLVTHAMHMRRAARAFRRAGLEVIPAPTYFYSVRTVAPAYAWILPSVEALLVSTLALRERFGLLWYAATGR